MSLQALKRMSLAKASVLIFLVAAVVATALMVGIGKGLAKPANPTDSTKVPHYFGPNPNWALSPLTSNDATVTITGDGTGAKATPAVDGNGVITGITITDPGSGYTSASVGITSTNGSGAAASATVSATTAVTAVTVTAGGSGYSKPTVTISGGGAGTQATATAYGGVDAVTMGSPGSGYTFPTVDFDMPDDPNGMQAKAHADFDQTTGAITGIVVDDPGSGYSTAPGVVIRDGTIFDPVPNGGTGATATATMKVLTVTVDTFGAGYTSIPDVAIDDTAPGTGTGATAAAQTDGGLVTAISVTSGGSGYLTSGGIKKFTDELPKVCDPSVSGSCPSYQTNPNAKYIPLGVPEVKTYNDASGRPIKADEYEIAVVQYRSNFSSSLPEGALVRGYVQLETPANAAISQHYPLTNELLDGTKVPITINGSQALAVTPPQWLGPTIAATKNKPVRVVFHNLLPTGVDGDLFLPVDSSMMGSGMGPMNMMDPMDQGSVMDDVRNPVCSEDPKPLGCFKDNRATLHLHGGISPWISDGTPHQWITPAGETTDWPEGVSVENVPDMKDSNGNVLGDAPDDGVQTFFYTNQQSARLMFYHDHSWGITRLNVYAGEAAGYLISDDTEKALVTAGTIPGAADTIPLVVQDRTFVPGDAQLYDQKDTSGTVTSYGQDPTWDKTRWGGKGNLWYHHVYMPAQNPGDPGGMSAYGRWMYGPWFWPPAKDAKYGPIDNPYYNPNCKLDDPTTWQYQTDPFCEPAKIPGTPNISVGMEQFNDTPIVNGVAYPTVTLEPKTYRLRMLNAANDRFFNFQWYIADASTASLGLNGKGEVIGGTEVALDPAKLAAAQTDPVVFPTPVQGAATAGPDWIQIGTEGGFLPAPVVVDGQQPTTFITDPTRFDVGNVDQHSLLLAPAERADVIVDFSQFAGKTLILYNDAPAAFPARVPSYDYYTGAPDQSPNGAANILPGYGPNTRTVMQVKIAGAAAQPFNLTALRTAFQHKTNGTGVFESGQHPIIVGQAAYNSAYGTGFTPAGDCSAAGTSRCDGFVRVSDTANFGFNTLKSQSAKVTMPLQPKAIHDEMNASSFDEFGRMTANLGIEAQPPTPGLQNVTLYPYVNPSTELIDGTSLPKEAVTYDANGNPVSDVKITAISDMTDGSQIWRITHNGVDTHPIHFHLFDVQLLNRVTWDNIIIAPDKEELGWKDTVRISPLEDTIVALRPIVPELPFEVPNSIRNLNPMMPTGSTAMFNNIDVQGNPTNPITNQLVNFGWEYVYHCHILSHEEMDMMRPVSLALPPNKPDGLSIAVDGTGAASRFAVTFNDNSITETSFVLQRSTDGGTTWTDAATSQSPLDQANTAGSTRTLTDPNSDVTVGYQYRIVAKNTVGYGGEYPSMTAQSISAAVTAQAVPLAPTGLTATATGTSTIRLDWTNHATNATNLEIQRGDGATPATWSTVATVAAVTVTWTDSGLAENTTYSYRVRAVIDNPPNPVNPSAWSNTATATTFISPPAAPSSLTATATSATTVVLNWIDNATNEASFQIQRGTGANPTTWTTVATVGANTTTWTNTGMEQNNTFTYRVRAVNAGGNSAWSNTATVTMPIAGLNAPLNLVATALSSTSVRLVWTDTSTTETAFQIQRGTGANPTNWNTVGTVGANVTTWTNTGLSSGTTYSYRVRASNAIGSSPWSNVATVTTPVGTVPAAPSNLRVTARSRTTITIAWNDNSNNETGFYVERRRLNSATWTRVSTRPSNSTSWQNTGLTNNTFYVYRVQAYSAAGTSAYSNTVTTSTLP